MAIGRVTDAEIVSALKAYAKHGTLRGAARELGCHNSSIRDRMNLAASRGLTVDSKVTTGEDRLRADLRERTRDVDRLTKERDDAIEESKTVAGILARNPEPPAWLSPPTKRPGGVSKEVPVLFISDIHHGETVFEEEMAGVNKFNREISKSRLQLLFTEAVDLLKNHVGRAVQKFPGIVCALGGDMITGDIHEELEITNDGYTIQAVDELTDILIAGLTLLAKEFGSVFVPCVVGNHGRNTRRWRVKGKVYTSYEFLIYRNLARHFAGDRRLTFLIPGEVDAFFKISGQRFLLTHGDTLGVKGGDGIIGAIGPIMRGTVKLGTSEAQIGRDFDFLMMGHWHYPLYLPRTIVNGCVKGYDEYARVGLRVPYAPASQMLFLVHPTRGLTMRREILLQDALTKRQKLTTDDAWVAVRAAP